jgi:hypothetical protein
VGRRKSAGLLVFVIVVIVFFVKVADGPSGAYSAADTARSTARCRDALAEREPRRDSDSVRADTAAGLRGRAQQMGIKIGAKIVGREGYVMFRMTE